MLRVDLDRVLVLRETDANRWFDPQRCQNRGRQWILWSWSRWPLPRCPDTCPGAPAQYAAHINKLLTTEKKNFSPWAAHIYVNPTRG